MCWTLCYWLRCSKKRSYTYIIGLFGNIQSVLRLLWNDHNFFQNQLKFHLRQVNANKAWLNQKNNLYAWFTKDPCPTCQKWNISCFWKITVALFLSPLRNLNAKWKHVELHIDLVLPIMEYISLIISVKIRFHSTGRINVLPRVLTVLT